MRPCSAYTVQRALPGWPCLVLIATTPFAASVPYSADAAGPFTTSTDSKSSGFRSLIGLGGAHPTSQMPEERFWLVTRMPSTKYTGSFVSERLFVPRIRTRDGAPVTVPGRTSTPAALAIRRSVTFVIGAVSTSLAASIRAIELPTSRLAWSPVERHDDLLEGVGRQRECEVDDRRLARINRHDSRRRPKADRACPYRRLPRRHAGHGVAPLGIRLGDQRRPQQYYARAGERLPAGLIGDAALDRALLSRQDGGAGAAEQEQRDQLRTESNAHTDSSLRGVWHTPHERDLVKSGPRGNQRT